jgi:hypothetical protein
VSDDSVSAILGVVALIVFVVIWIILEVVLQIRQRAESKQRRLDEEREKNDEKQEFEKERESTTLEYRELVEGFARLVWDCRSPWEELERTAQALNGGNGLQPLQLIVGFDVSRIIKAFSVANGSTPNGLGRLYHAIFAKLEAGDRLTVEDSVQKIKGQEHTPPELPLAIEPLSAFDKLRQTHLAADVAGAYYSLVIRASGCCSASMAVDALRTKYVTLLKPYISADFNNWSESPSGSFNGHCPECASSFSVLGLQPDASTIDIKAAYRDLAQINHPDRFGGNERLRRKADEQMKEINQAYKHVTGEH